VFLKLCDLSPSLFEFSRHTFFKSFKDAFGHIGHIKCEPIKKIFSDIFYFILFIFI